MDNRRHSPVLPYLGTLEERRYAIVKRADPPFRVDDDVLGMLRVEPEHRADFHPAGFLQVTDCPLQFHQIRGSVKLTCHRDSSRERETRSSQPPGPTLATFSESCRSARNCVSVIVSAGRSTKTARRLGRQ